MGKPTKTRLRPPRQCEVCGETYIPSYGAQRTCSRACGTFIRPYVKFQSELYWRTCSVCGEAWVANHRPRHCEPPAPSCRVYIAPCAWCDTVFATRHSTKRYCTDRCRDMMHPQRSKVTHICYGECVQCGGIFVRRASQLGGFCSQGCANRARRRRERKRLRNVTKRDRYTLRQVAERDGWRCHLCGKRVPDRPYKARATDATVDHLIPLAAGGDDTLDNVALAHNRCNWQRCTSGEAQLRLIA